MAPASKPAQFVCHEHGAGGVGGTGDDQPVECAGVRHHVCAQPEAGLGCDGNLDDLDVQCFERVAVAGIAGCSHRHTVAGLEARQERERERPAGTLGNDDATGIGVVAVPVGVVLDQPRAQRFDAHGRRVTQHVVVDGRLGSSARPGRRGSGWLADLHVHHLAAGSFPVGGSPHHLHHKERRNVRPLGDLQAAHRPLRTGIAREVMSGTRLRNE